MMILRHELSTDMIKNCYDRINDFARTHPGMRIRSLSWRIDAENLKEIHCRMDRNKAKGIDGISKDDYDKDLDENIEILVGRIVQDTYKLNPSRRIYIPKLNDKKRPFGISSYAGKLVEGCVAALLLAVYETRFKKCSYGFRSH